jgi:hypothetical protein
MLRSQPPNTGVQNRTSRRRSLREEAGEHVDQPVVGIVAQHLSGLATKLLSAFTS